MRIFASLPNPSSHHQTSEDTEIKNMDRKSCESIATKIILFPSVYISPDSLSSELERFSLSTETDLSLPLSLPISGDDIDLSLSPGSRSTSLRLSSLHLSSPPYSLHLSCDGERSRSRVCDDLRWSERIIINGK